jgi:porin
MTGLAVCLTVAPAGAGEPLAPSSGAPDPSIATTLPTGIADPGEKRARLATYGITYGVNSIGEVLGVVSGGLKRGFQVDGRLELVTDVDLETLMGWRGLTFHANAFQIHGRSISAENVGSLAPVSFIEATSTTRLFEIWLEQSFADGKISIRAGQLAADSEFLTSEGGGAFINGTFGWPTITAANLPDGGPAHPLATPGARLKLAPSEDLTFLAGFFNGEVARPCASDDPQRCNRHGLEFPFGDPVFMMLEGQAKYKVGLPGALKIGGWNHFGDFDDTRFDSAGGRIAFTSGAARVLSGNHGLYAVMDQTLWWRPGTDSGGIAAFARVIGAPDDRNLIDIYLDGGLTFAGFVPGRPDDVFGIGAAYSQIASGARGADRDRNSANVVDLPVRSHETVLEISYKAQIVPGWTVQPDFQYVWNPGGGGSDPDDEPAATRRAGSATVIGLRTTINY